jgi:hypothetical protein
MEILRKIDAKLMQWLVKRGPDGLPHLRKWRAIMMGVVSAGFYVWAGRKYLHGEWPSLYEYDLLVLFPLHTVYMLRAWREVERRPANSLIAELPKVEIPPARIIPPGTMPSPPRRERVREAVRRAMR